MLLYDLQKNQIFPHAPAVGGGRFLVFFFFFFFFYRGCRGEFFFFISSFSLFLIAFCFKKNNGTFLHTCDTPKHVFCVSVLRTWQRRSKGDGAASLQAALHLHCRPYNSNRPTTYCSIFSNSHNQSILLISNIFLGITSYNIYRAFGKPFCQTLSRLPKLSTLSQPVNTLKATHFPCWL